MSLLSLSFTLGFVVIALGVATWQRLGIQRDMIVSVVRATIQLLIVGYILKALFASKSTFFTVLMLLVMISVAVENARRRGKGIPGIWWRLAIAITITVLFTVGFLVVTRVIPWTPQYVISIGGIVTGNAMILSSLFLNHLSSETKNRREEVTVLLSLGATPTEAIRHVVKRAIRTSMIPNIDSMKTTGIVQLPGMMVGQILAGQDPVVAVRYQLLILFAVLSAAALTSITLGYLTKGSLFNRHMQLLETFTRREA